MAQFTPTNVTRSATTRAPSRHWLVRVHQAEASDGALSAPARARIPGLLARHLGHARGDAVRDDVESGESEQRGHHLLAGLIAAARILGKRLLEDGIEIGRHIRMNLAGWLGRLRRDPVENLRHALTLERRAPGQELIQDDAEGEKIGSAVHRAPRSCSGDMNPGDPTIWSVPVRSDPGRRATRSR